jgi:hypothetical protein
VVTSRCRRGRWEFRLKEVLTSKEILGDRRNALEEAFVARENAKLRQQLLDLDNTKRTKEALAAASGATNDAVLEKLVALNISSETVAALAPVPLIAIAWSDGSIDDKERAAVLAKAPEEAVSEGNVSHELFEQRLSERPPANLFATWKDYVRALGETMSAEHRRFFKGRVLDRARGAAEAAPRRHRPPPGAGGARSTRRRSGNCAPSLGSISVLTSSRARTQAAAHSGSQSEAVTAGPAARCLPRPWRPHGGLQTARWRQNGGRWLHALTVVRLPPGCQTLLP